MNIRKANLSDLDSIEQIYNDIHSAEENDSTTIGWVRNVYPTRKTAENAIARGDMFVLEEGSILGAGIINQIQGLCQACFANSVLATRFTAIKPTGVNIGTDVHAGR